MIETAPSDRISDFIDFCRKTPEGHPVDKRRGASDRNIIRLATMYFRSLPQIYINYLREFGEFDGGLDILGETFCNIEFLLEERAAEIESGPPTAPEGRIDIAKEWDWGGYALWYGPQADRKEPCVAGTWDGRIEWIAARSFRNFIYGNRYYHAVLCPDVDFILKFKEKESVLFAADFAESLGFRRYWFSDEYQACLERGEHRLMMCPNRNGLEVLARVADPAECELLKRSLTDFLTDFEAKY